MLAMRALQRSFKGSLMSWGVNCRTILACHSKHQRKQSGRERGWPGCGERRFGASLVFPIALATAARMEKRQQRKQHEELEAPRQTLPALQPPGRTKRQDRL
jgi:hypothetical protein